jgi:hypothetical protein
LPNSSGVIQSLPVQLPVKETFSELHLLTAVEPGPAVAEWKASAAQARAVGEHLPDRLTLAVATLQYADGSTVQIHLRYGEALGAAVRDWWNPEDGFIYHLPFAEIASAQVKEEGGLLYDVQYATRLVNPRPQDVVSSVTIAPAEALRGGQILLGGMKRVDAPVQGRLFFVDPSGRDEAVGSWDQPWATLGHAAATLGAGDTVYVRGGLYRPEKRIVFRDLQAPPEHPTRVIGWPGETATFDFMDAHWDMSPERESLGSETYPHDASMIHIYNCDGFVLKNLHMTQSRARGFGAEQCRNVMLAYNSLFRSFGPGIRFSGITNGWLIANTVIRPTSLSMGPTSVETAGSGPVVMQTSATNYIQPVAPSYMPQINPGRGKPSRKPPMEGLDCGKLWNVEFGYNEIAWGDKELLLVDGDVDGLRMHHMYVHDAHNRPWVAGIAPNGYGKQQNIEMDHNIAIRCGSAIGIGTEGGGMGREVRIHHNLSMDCFWNAHGVTGAWGDSDADLTHVKIYNNTAFNNGHLDENQGPAGGISLSFSSGKGKVGRTVSGVVQDITVANNLILQARDYALGLVNPADLEANRIVFAGNLTDFAGPSALFELERNQKWRAVQGPGLTVLETMQLRNPSARDFRPLEGSPAQAGGVALREDGTVDPAGGASYIGAFGPGARWVEVTGAEPD